MLSIIVAVISGLSTGLICYYNFHISVVWSVFWGLTVFVLIQILLALFIRQKIKVIMNEIQELLNKGQADITRKIQFLQQKFQTGKAIQKQLESDKNELMKKAVELTEKFNPYLSWNFLLKKQVITMRMQFYYQLKEYDKVDELLPKCLYIEPITIAMKMARQYMRNENINEIEKTYKSGIKKFPGDKSEIIYALYSWILVKRNEIDKAIKVLAQAKEVTDSEALVNNWKALVNGKVKQFSNAAIGEQWYLLDLEKPKLKKKAQKVKRQKAHLPF